MSKKTLVYQNLEYKTWKEESEEAKASARALDGIGSSGESYEKPGELPQRWGAMEHAPRKSVSDGKLWRIFGHGGLLDPQLSGDTSVSPCKNDSGESSPEYTRPKEILPMRAASSVNLSHFTPTPPGLAPRPQYAPPYMYTSAPSPSYAYLQPVYVPMNPSWQGYPSQPDTLSSGTYLTGRLKFFDELQQYGFFILDTDGSDLFVHYDDLLKSGVTLNVLQEAKVYDYRFAFQCMSYYGKYNLSRKAVNIRVLNARKSLPAERKVPIAAAFTEFSSNPNPDSHSNSSANGV